MIRIKYIPLIIILALMGCGPKNVYVFENGKVRPNHVTNFVTMDGKLHVSYSMVRHKEIKVGKERMTMPEYIPLYEGKWLRGDEKLEAVIYIVNPESIPIKLVYDHRVEQLLGKVSYEYKKTMYEGRLPYLEVKVKIHKVKGKNILYFTLYSEDKIKCFTREIVFNY